MVMSEGDPDMFTKLSRLPIYDFLFRILTLKKHQKGKVKDDSEPFGFGLRASQD